jgi:calcineurin-like phosphoesterase family protein
MNNVYFTADLHLRHKNILKYDNRPFSSISSHDNMLIENWNKTVHIGDSIYFLGDFGLTGINYLKSIMERLNGTKYFIKGNHDKSDIIKLYKDYGTYLGELAEISINNQKIVLCHYAMLVWNKSHHGTWHLHGHSHHSLPVDQHSLRLDVGTNGWNYCPISFEKVKEELSKRIFKPIDHHG